LESKKLRNPRILREKLDKLILLQTWRSATSLHRRV
jgi:hypothetical protein